MQHPDESKARAEREQMVTRQIAARGVSDPRVLEALRCVPRHRFVPPGLVHAAHDDGPLAIGDGQTISQPFIVALMSEALQLTGDEKVLEIGTGSGYQTAVLAELTRPVYSIEIVPALARRARETLARAGYDSVQLRTSDGALGWPEGAPFDAILITAAPATVPDGLLDQLAPGGRMVVPVGPSSGSQDLRLITRTAQGSLHETSLVPVSFVPMTGLVGQP
jgi:protein-L-isoaspartate(D-aspartate) O-methyltransferase